MARDIYKYAAAGKKRLAKSNGRYDLYSSEIYELMAKADKGTTEMFYAICNAYEMGVEAGARLTINQGKARKASTV